MRGRLNFAALILAIATSEGLADQVTLGDVSVTLPPPAGFCEVNASDPRDRRAVMGHSGPLEKLGNRLLGLFADCGQLAQAREGGRRQLDDAVEYHAQIAAIDKPPAASVAQLCAAARARNNTILANEAPDLKARIERTVEKVKMNETRPIGVLAEDTNACYQGSIQKDKGESGTDKTMVGLGAVTIIKNRTIFVYRFSVYQNPNTVDAVLAKLKADVAALIAANPSQVTIGSVSVVLPPPAGFCELNASDPRDGRLLAMVSGGVEKLGDRLLEMSADCGQLSEARAGRPSPLDELAQYRTPIAAMDKPPAQSVAQACAILRAKGNRIQADHLPDLKARVASAAARAKMGETSDLGVLAEDANACYSGVILGGTAPVVGTGAFTIIRNRTIGVYRFSAYQNPDSVDAMLAKLKVDVAALIAANP
jgi:hypothetical protein